MKKSYTGFFTVFYSLMIFFFLSFTVVGDDVNMAHFLRFSENPLSSLFAFLGIFWLCRKCISLLLVPRGGGFYFLSLIICGVFSGFSILAVFFQSEVSIKNVFYGHPVNLFLTGIVFLAGMVTFYAVIQLIGALPKLSFGSAFNKVSSRLFDKGMFWKALAVMAIFWLPQILYSAPGTLTIDTINSLEMYWGAEPPTTQHPILYTILAGKLMDLGIAMGNATLGLIFLVIIQTAALLLVLAYTLETMKRFEAPCWLLALTLVFFSTAPIFYNMASTAIIDTLYGAFFLLLMNELVYYLFKHEIYRRTWSHYLLTAIAVLGLHLRHNGIYISLAVIILSVIMELYLLVKKKQKIVFSLLFLAVLLLPAFGGKSLSNALYDSYGAQRLTSRAMLALPIQQTARCLAIYGDEIDPEILADIQRVMTWDIGAYQEAYDPLSFDGVKRSFNPAATSEDIAAFLRGWLKLVRTYPASCITATMNQTYFLFSPAVLNQKYYRSPGQKLTIEGYNFKDLNRKCHASSRRLARIDDRYYTYGMLPGLGLLVNQGFTNLVLLTVSLYALCKKNGRILFLCVPLLLTLAICFVGPMVARQPRYTYPIMYCLPLLIGIFSVKMKSVLK